MSKTEKAVKEAVEELRIRRISTKNERGNLIYLQVSQSVYDTAFGKRLINFVARGEV